MDPQPKIMMEDKNGREAFIQEKIRYNENMKAVISGNAIFIFRINVTIIKNDEFRLTLEMR